MTRYGVYNSCSKYPCPGVIVLHTPSYGDRTSYIIRYCNVCSNSSQVSPCHNDERKINPPCAARQKLCCSCRVSPNQTFNQCSRSPAELYITTAQSNVSHTNTFSRVSPSSSLISVQLATKISSEKREDSST